MWYEVLEHRPGWRAHANLGLLDTVAGRYSEAIAHYDEALRGNPDSLEIHYTLAFIYERRGETDKAIEHYRTFLKFNPDNASVRDRLDAALAEREKAAR